MKNIDQAIQTLADTLKAQITARNIDAPLMIGIHTGGVWVAEQLHKLLEIDAPLSTLDISFYRDDYTRIGVNPQVKPSAMPLSIDDRHIILVDDVLYTGRTIRAAMNELFDYGRPSSILLATLIDRSGRELPIQADACGMTLDLKPNQHIKLQRPNTSDPGSNSGLMTLHIDEVT